MSVKHPTPQYWDYNTAPDSPILQGMGVTTRQLRRWVDQGKVSHLKIGGKIRFSEEHLRELVERSTVHAVR